MGFESTGAREKSAAIESLKWRGMNIDGYYNAITGETMEKGQDLEPNTWNENAGVIAFVDGQGKFFAVPSTDSFRSQLMNDPMVKQARIGVPALGNPEIWHKDPKKGEETSGFKAWQELTWKYKDWDREASEADSAEPTSDELGEHYSISGPNKESEYPPLLDSNGNKQFDEDGSLILDIPDDVIEKELDELREMLGPNQTNPNTPPPFDTEVGFNRLMEKIRKEEGKQ